MTSGMHPPSARRRAFKGLVPPVLILSAYSLLVFGLISGDVYFVFLTGLICFLLGRLSAVMQTSEEQRRMAVEGIEATIEGLHRGLDEETIPDELRETAERDLSMMVESLTNLDRMAPWHVRWRRRRERAAR